MIKFTYRNEITLCIHGFKKEFYRIISNVTTNFVTRPVFCVSIYLTHNIVELDTRKKFTLQIYGSGSFEIFLKIKIETIFTFTISNYSCL